MLIPKLPYNLSFYHQLVAIRISAGGGGTAQAGINHRMCPIFLLPRHAAPPDRVSMAFCTVQLYLRGGILLNPSILHDGCSNACSLIPFLLYKYLHICDVSY